MNRLRHSRTALVLLPCLAAGCGTMTFSQKTTLVAGGSVLAASGIIVWDRMDGPGERSDDRVPKTAGAVLIITGAALILAGAFSWFPDEPSTDEVQAQAPLDLCQEWLALRQEEPDPARRTELDAALPARCKGAPGQPAPVVTPPAATPPAATPPAATPPGPPEAMSDPATP